MSSSRSLAHVAFAEFAQARLAGFMRSNMSDVCLHMLSIPGLDPGSRAVRDEIGESVARHLGAFADAFEFHARAWCRGGAVAPGDTAPSDDPHAVALLGRLLADAGDRAPAAPAGVPDPQAIARIVWRATERLHLKPVARLHAGLAVAAWLAGVLPDYHAQMQAARADWATQAPGPQPRAADGPARRPGAYDLADFLATVPGDCL